MGACEFGGSESRIHGERESYKPGDAQAQTFKPSQFSVASLKVGR